MPKKDISPPLGSRLDHLERLIKKLFSYRTPNPTSISLTVKGENMDQLGFEVSVPRAPGSDIVGGELRVKIGTGEEQIFPTTPEQTEVTGLTGPQGAKYQLSFVYIDDAGNRSKIPSVLSGVLTDTIPPPNPGELGIRVVSETSP